MELFYKTLHDVKNFHKSLIFCNKNYSLFNYRDTYSPRENEYLFYKIIKKIKQNQDILFSNVIKKKITDQSLKTYFTIEKKLYNSSYFVNLRIYSSLPKNRIKSRSSKFHIGDSFLKKNQEPTVNEKSPELEEIEEIIKTALKK